MPKKQTPTVPRSHHKSSFPLEGIQGSATYFANRPLHQWTYDSYASHFGGHSNSIRQQYNNDLDQLRGQQIPRPVKGYITGLMQAPFTADNNQGPNQSYTATGNSIIVANSSNVTLNATREYRPEPKVSRNEIEEDLSSNNPANRSFDEHQHRIYIYDYLEGVEDWKPVGRWIIDDLDITEKLVLYRARSINLAKAGENLSDNRVLSLSNVFVLTANQSSSCVHRFEKSYHQHMLQAFTLKEGWHTFPV
ncbi:predicted protein [Lichtheimia corymbifera JMRC:FSU:9682]|uniref:Uncharacterized protein n=1 Tax=Lichtheimia corymbifera JMRC:FSU:9682 TaxID=1263082 RepID=A0A068SHD2_9FUNG|nr:predicted protein [Lichtheimia corymbifera JMRC:FSU:9682]